MAPRWDTNALNYATVKLKFQSLITACTLIPTKEVLVNVGITIFLITNLKFSSLSLFSPFSLSSLLCTIVLPPAFVTTAFKNSTQLLLSYIPMPRLEWGQITHHENILSFISMQSSISRPPVIDVSQLRAYLDL